MLQRLAVTIMAYTGGVSIAALQNGFLEKAIVFLRFQKVYFFV